MDGKNFKDTLLRGIALLGLILVLVLGAWGIIVLAFNAPNFIGSAVTSVRDILTGDESEDDETVRVPVVSTSTPSAPTTPAKPATPTSPKQPTYTYTPAPQPVTQLYGYPDLYTRILSVVPQGSRYSVAFEVSNIGTNVAGAGWTFNAELPYENEYTFTSAPQQMLRPGDKIVYTLGFDAPYYGYDHNDRYDDERYDDCNENYNRWDLDEWEDWYEDVFDRNIGNRDDWDEGDWEDWYDDFCDDHDEDDNDYYNDGTVRVIVNPYGALYELNRNNNTATQRINFNYSNYGTPYYWNY